MRDFGNRRLTRAQSPPGFKRQRNAYCDAGGTCMRLPLIGGCLCGSVRYEVHTAPRSTFYCHCRDCQKETGGPYATEIYVAHEALKIAGPRVSFAVIGESGKEV